MHKSEARRTAMGVLKRKEERSETVTVRVPGSVKAELDRLREETAAAGFDLNATLSEAVIRMAKQVREELHQVADKANGARGPGRMNGFAAAAVADGKTV
jgi:hypothetical protein